MSSADIRVRQHNFEENFMKVKTNLRAGRRHDGKDDGPNHH